MIDPGTAMYSKKVEHIIGVVVQNHKVQSGSCAFNCVFDQSKADMVKIAASKIAQTAWAWGSRERGYDAAVATKAATVADCLFRPCIISRDSVQ
jgi:hypothetical protein